MTSETTTSTRPPAAVPFTDRDSGRQLRHDAAAANQSGCLSLVRTLCSQLEEEQIVYCHWKSNNALDRSASGDNDLDLLVRRTDIRKFTETLFRLGFKAVIDPPPQRIPGIRSYYGYDAESRRLVHVHAHYQLVVGHDMSKNYRLPIERAYLESADHDSARLFKIPAPEFELIVFVLRMVLKHSTWDTLLSRQGSLSRSERQELEFLYSNSVRPELNRLLAKHLQHLGTELFEACEATLRAECGFWFRALAGYRLQTALQANARRPRFVDVCLKFGRRATRAVRRRCRGQLPRSRLANGGALIALVGGDGAGKTTALHQLDAWLSKEFDVVSVHLGKPRWSWTTVGLRGILKLGKSLGLYAFDPPFRGALNQQLQRPPGFPWLIRQVCVARDRYRAYLRARRFANNGWLVLLDRLPHAKIRLMDGPQVGRCFLPHNTGRLARALLRLEESYYEHIDMPELLFVLRVDPDVAVQRKTDEDPATVRERSTEIWNLTWDHTTAHVIDASQPKAAVLTELQRTIWSDL